MEGRYINRSGWSVVDNNLLDKYPVVSNIRDDRLLFSVMFKHGRRYDLLGWSRGHPLSNKEKLYQLPFLDSKIISVDTYVPDKRMDGEHRALVYFNTKDYSVEIKAVSTRNIEQLPMIKQAKIIEFQYNQPDEFEIYYTHSNNDNLKRITLSSYNGKYIIHMTWTPR